MIPPPHIHDFDSGLPARSVLHEDDQGFGLTAENREDFWLDGGDADLFSVRFGDPVPYDLTGNGVNDGINFTRHVESARPVPEGTYKFHLNIRGTFHKRCDGYTNRYEWTVPVTAPEGVLHEAFFDPVTVGTTVAADDANGQLKPTSFTGANGSSATLEAISWEAEAGDSGAVQIEVDPDYALAGHILDFIELDGTVSLSLHAFDATVDTVTNTLTWSMSSQPWHDGDLLMVRIREAPPSCSNSSAVANPRTEQALVGDCKTLLALKDALAGTATLNWSLDTPIASWDGVTVSGTPRRVTEIDLESRNLTGVLPAGLGDLTGLERLALSFNGLSGSLPSELGNLSNLRELVLFENDLSGELPTELGSLSDLDKLSLSGNSFTGPIPPALGGLQDLGTLSLQDNRLSGQIPAELGGLARVRFLHLSNNELSGTVPWELGELGNLVNLTLSGNNLEGCLRPTLRSIQYNDLSETGLPDCSHDGRVSAPGGLSVTLVGGTFTLTWNAVTGAARYEAQYRTAGSQDDWVGLPATEAASAAFSPGGSPGCETYEFRARSYGDGTTYAPGWGAESPVTTAPCNRDPEFGQASYSFSIGEDAPVGDTVGTVTATDADEGDSVSYSITAGNEDGKFALASETGVITVAAGLDHEAAAAYTLTVEASDGRGGTGSATVEIDVTDVAENPPPAPSDVGVTLADGTFTITWTAVTGAAKYEAQHKTDAEGSAWTALPETTGLSVNYAPADGPACSATYQFRVRAHGDGDTHTAMWGVESAVATVDTGTCDPEFGQASYFFFILDTAATESAVGNVSATDPDTGDTVTYAVTAGNDDGKFSIDGATGQLTVAGTFDIAATPYYTLAVEASDGQGGTATARVTVALTIAECYNDTAVPYHEERPRMVRDCSVLLTAKDALRGAASLNWSSDLPIEEWLGIYRGYRGGRYSLDGADLVVRDVIVSRRGLGGSIPPVLAGLVDLRRLDLDDNALTGGIPAVLGRMESLEMLILLGNRLTGGIPAELGNLADLRILSLYANDLTGSIPPELGKLTKLTQLLLDDNDFTGQLPSELGNIAGLQHLFVRDSRLTGEVQAWLASLDDLEYLYLEGNDFTGCIPAGLRDVVNNDLDSLELAYCSPAQ